MPLDAAQYFFKVAKKIDSAQIVLKPGVDEDVARKEIEKLLPTGVSVRKPEARSPIAEETSLSTQQGMSMARAFSLVVAVFIIANTFLINVTQRRKQLGIMRAIGGTRRQIAGMVFREAMLMGIVGTILGSVLGVVAAHFLTKAMGSLYQAKLPPIDLSEAPFLIGTWRQISSVKTAFAYDFPRSIRGRRAVWTGSIVAGRGFARLEGQPFVAARSDARRAGGRTRRFVAMVRGHWCCFCRWLGYWHFGRQHRGLAPGVACGLGSAAVAHWPGVDVADRALAAFRSRGLLVSATGSGRRQVGAAATAAASFANDAYGRCCFHRDQHGNRPGEFHDGHGRRCAELVRESDRGRFHRSGRVAEHGDRCGGRLAGFNRSRNQESVRH